MFANLFIRRIIPERLRLAKGGFDRGDLRLDGRGDRRIEQIDEEPAVKVVGFVLEGSTVEVVGIDEHFITGQVVGPNPHFSCALDVRIERGEAQASLFGGDCAFGGQNLRINEDAKVARVAVGRAVDDKDLPRGAHLRRGKAAARCRIHGFRHVVDEPAKLRRNNLDLFARFAKPGVGVMQDGADSHGK